MAGNAKPNIQGLGEESKYKVINLKASAGSGGTIDNCGLFDGITIGGWNNLSCFCFSGIAHFLEIEMFSTSNIWRCGCQSNESSKSLFTILKWNRTTYDDVTSSIAQTTNAIDNTKWEKTISNLPKGRYKFNITGNDGGRTDSEWYIESCNKTKFLLHDGDKCISVEGGNANINIIPNMTGNNIPGGVASASSEQPASYLAWKAFNKINSTQQDAWLSNGTQTGWLCYEFNNDKIVGKYAITNENQSDSSKSAPRDWTFEGSNNGSNWTVLDTRSNEINWTNASRREYIFSNTDSYLYYRVNVTANNGYSYWVAIGELEMYEYILPKSITMKYPPTEQDFLDKGMDGIPPLYKQDTSQTLDFVEDKTLEKGKVYKVTVNKDDWNSIDSFESKQ